MKNNGDRNIPEIPDLPAVPDDALHYMIELSCAGEKIRFEFICAQQDNVMLNAGVLAATLYPAVTEVQVIDKKTNKPIAGINIARLHSRLGPKISKLIGRPVAQGVQIAAPGDFEKFMAAQRKLRGEEK